MDEYDSGIDVMERDELHLERLAGRARWLVDARWSRDGFYDPDARPRTWRRRSGFED